MSTLTLLELQESIQTEEEAQDWLKKMRWGEKPICPHCKSCCINELDYKNKMPYWCRECRNFFSVRTGTQMENSRLSLKVWVMSIYLYLNNPKGLTSVLLSKYLGIRQATTWFLLHRIREMCKTQMKKFKGTVEVDETYIGGKRINMSKYRRMIYYHLGRGSAGKIPVIGALERETNTVVATVVDRTDSATVHAFVYENTTDDSVIYTDEAKCYNGMDRTHELVCHSKREFVDGDIHTNGIESFWARIKRSYKGTHHWWSKKHLQRYVNELTWKHNHKSVDVLDRMILLVQHTTEERLTYQKLITG